jgi:predicted glycosyltransferase
MNISHPAHVHLFKNCIWGLERLGHHIKITSVEKEITSYLLKAYGLKYSLIGKSKPGLISKAFELISIDAKLYKISSSFCPDVLLGGVGNVYVTHIAQLINKPSVIFDDTEHSKIEHCLMDPFASVICTPSCYSKDLGKRQLKYDGYNELAYLHPNYFTPNSAVLDEVDLNMDDPFIVVRFISWTASHDVGHHGVIDKVGMVRELEKYGRVLITSEERLPKELQPNQIRIAPEKLHDLLYYATLYMGEGGTMATEAALLGTPSIYVSSLAYSMGNFLELEKKYGILFRYMDTVNALSKAVELVSESGIKAEWQKKRERLMEDKIDVTSFMVWFIENYPESCKVIRNNPRWQDRFR